MICVPIRSFTGRHISIYHPTNVTARIILSVGNLNQLSGVRKYGPGELAAGVVTTRSVRAMKLYAIVCCLQLKYLLVEWFTGQSVKSRKNVGTPLL